MSKLLSEHSLSFCKEGQIHNVLNNAQDTCDQSDDSSYSRSSHTAQDQNDQVSDDSQNVDDNDHLEDVIALSADLAVVELIGKLDDTGDNEDG